MGGKVAIVLGLVAGLIVGGLLVAGVVALVPAAMLLSGSPIAPAATPPATSAPDASGDQGAVPATGAAPSAESGPTDVPMPVVTPGPVSVFASDGPFQLELQLPKTTFAASEPITGQGVLSTVDGEDEDVAGSGSGLITFSYAEIGGTRSMGGEATADCSPYTIAADDPLTVQLTNGAGWSADDPDAAFYEAFATAPDVRLPPGAWQITARAAFLGPECTLPEQDLRASTVIVVTP